MSDGAPTGEAARGEGLLDQPAEESARRLALLHLESTRRARSALDAGDDPEALHDLRVALRRLRSTERAFADELRPSLGKKLRRRLRQLARATNPGRDAEVGAAIVARWLAELEAGPERRAAEELARRLAARRDRAYADLGESFLRRVDTLLDRLERQLAVWRREVRLREPAKPPPALRRRIADELAHQRSRFETALDAAADGDAEAAHAARIEAKRLRYLLEPHTDELPEAAAPIERLKQLQDLLGDGNDLALLAAELAEVAADGERRRLIHLAGVAPRAGSSPGGRRGQRALALRVARERRELADAFATAWLLPRAAERKQIGCELDAVAAALAD